MTRPRLLDLFCGQGGASRGYDLAGFDPVGLDLMPQPKYPYEFHQGDALDRSAWPPGPFAAIHASPVCKLHTKATQMWKQRGRTYPNQIPPTRELLEAEGVPWVIENVPGAPLRADYVLCGCLFGLATESGYLVRERWFETSWRGFDLRAPCWHEDLGPGAISVAGHGVASWSRAIVGPVKLAERRRLMRCEWMDRNGLGEAIPPPYTELIGAALLAEVERTAA